MTREALRAAASWALWLAFFGFIYYLPWLLELAA